MQTGLKYSRNSSAFSLKNISFLDHYDGMQAKRTVSIPTNTSRWTNIGLMVAHFLRPWSSIKHTLADVSCFLDWPSLPVEGVCVRGGGGVVSSFDGQTEPPGNYIPIGSQPSATSAGLLCHYFRYNVISWNDYLSLTRKALLIYNI